MKGKIDVNGTEIKVGDWVRDGGTDRDDVRRGMAGEVVFSHEDILLVRMLTKKAKEIWGTRVVEFLAMPLIADDAEKELIKKLM